MRLAARGYDLYHVTFSSRLLKRFQFGNCTEFYWFPVYSNEYDELKQIHFGRWWIGWKASR